MTILTKMFSVALVIPMKSILSQAKCYWFPDNLVVKGKIVVFGEKRRHT